MIFGMDDAAFGRFLDERRSGFPKFIPIPCVREHASRNRARSFTHPGAHHTRRAPPDSRSRTTVSVVADTLRLGTLQTAPSAAIREGGSSRFWRHSRRFVSAVSARSFSLRSE